MDNKKKSENDQKGIEETKEIKKVNKINKNNKVNKDNKDKDKNINKKTKDNEKKLDENAEIIKNKNINFIYFILLTLIILILTYIYFNSTNKSELDLTKDQIYSLSKESKEKLEGINKEIEIEYASNVDNKIFTKIVNEINRIKPNIEIKIIDPMKPASDEIDFNRIVAIRSKKREENARSYVDLDKVYIYDMEHFTAYSTLEQDLINALISVQTAETENKPTIAFTTGHRRSK